jgi:hypothetical protein
VSQFGIVIPDLTHIRIVMDLIAILAKQYQKIGTTPLLGRAAPIDIPSGVRVTKSDQATKNRVK